MALNTMKYPLSHVAKRGFAAQAAAKFESAAPPEIQCSVLPNKLMLNTLDVCGPLSRVSVVFRVGPRNETHKYLGVVHTIRMMTGFGSPTCSAFAIWRNIQHNGGHLYCTGDRETTGFHLITTRNKITETLKFLASAVTPAFKPWEVKDNLYRLKYEIGGLSPQVKVMDNLHAAAFRTGLGNSLFIAEDRIGSLSPAMLETFYKDAFTANRACVTGYNISQPQLLEFAKSLDLNANDPCEGNSKFYGGEIRTNVNSYFAHVAIGAKGAGLKDVKEALAFCVLQHALGIRPSTSWGGSPSPLYKAVYATTPNAGASCFNFAYSDTGLFGIIINSPADIAGNVVKEAVKVLKAGTISEADFKRGKAMVKLNVLYASENSENVVEDMSIQSLMGGLVVPGPVLAEAVDKLSLSDVTSAAKKVASSKLAMAAYGDLNNVPYMDEL